MSSQLNKSGNLQFSYLTAFPAIIQPGFSINQTNLNWNDYSRTSFYINSTISQASNVINVSNIVAPYGAISLTNYSSFYRLSVTSNTILNSILQVTITSVYMDDGCGIYTNVNSQSATNTTILSGNLFLWLSDPAAGQHYQGPVTSYLSVSSTGVNLGGYIDFYIAAGPTTPATGYFYQNGQLNVSFVPVISTIIPPTHLSYYSSQDFNIPASPLSLSNFHGAVVYDLVTFYNWNITQTNNPHIHTYYVYPSDGTYKQFSNQVVQLSSNTLSPYYISTKFSPISGILTTQNTILTINTPNSFSLLINVNSNTYNNLPLSYLINVPSGSSSYPLSSYLFNLSSYASFYVYSPQNQFSFTTTLSTSPLIYYPLSLLP